MKFNLMDFGEYLNSIPRGQKIENFIEELVECPIPSHSDTQLQICFRLGLDPGSLSYEEIEYIEEEVNKRREYYGLYRCHYNYKTTNRHNRK